MQFALDRDDRTRSRVDTLSNYGGETHASKTGNRYGLVVSRLDAGDSPTHEPGPAHDSSRADDDLYESRCERVLRGGKSER